MLYRYSFLFSRTEECKKAELWIRANFDCIEEIEIAHNELVLHIFTAVKLTKEQQRVMVSSTTPRAFHDEKEDV